MARPADACVAALREPSLGPGVRHEGRRHGRRHGDARARADINLHFTGDLHAITAAHNLLAAMVDNALHVPRRGRASTPARCAGAAPWT
jgi:formate--tetrahydrofolate ligase